MGRCLVAPILILIAVVVKEWLMSVENLAVVNRESYACIWKDPVVAEGIWPITIAEAVERYAAAKFTKLVSVVSA